MNKVMAIPKEPKGVSQGHFNQKQIEILKNSICKGVTNDEFEIFLMACVKTQLDPFMKQIHAVKRKCKKPDGSWGETMTIQTGIDGYRLIAERTGFYAPGQEPTYVLDEAGKLVSATAYVKKQTADGTWHSVSASAYMEEYCQYFVDKSTGEKRPSGMWSTLPRTMLAKCAESQALRKAFPAEMSGVYTKEEMAQADVEIAKISLEQAAEIEMILGDCDEKYRDWVFSTIKKQYKIDALIDLPLEIFDRIKTAALKNMQENHARQAAESKELLHAEVQ
jgi:phage recombination protein Bet